MKKTLFFLALIGWIMSLITHLLSFADYNIREQVPYIWVLHLGIFIIALPAIFILKKENNFIEFQKTSVLNQMNPISSFKVIFKNTPNWLAIIGVAGLFYAFFNFLIFFNAMPGTPAIENGQYILENHGVLSRIITEQEYQHFKATELRGISGHWIAFYGMGVALLFPYKSVRQLDSVAV